MSAGAAGGAGAGAEEGAWAREGAREGARGGAGGAPLGDGLGAALALAGAAARRGELVFWWTLGGPSPAVVAAWRGAPAAARARWVVVAPPAVRGCLRPLLSCALAGAGAGAGGGRVGALVLEWAARGADPPAERALAAALPLLARVCVQARVPLRVVCPPEEP